MAAVRFQVGGSPLAAIDAAPHGPGGAAAVLVPGYTGSKEDFLALLPRLAAAGHRTIAYDQRGQYESAGPDDATAYTVERLAADLLGLLDEATDEPVHLVGHSFGGLVARAAVIERPSAVRSLSLLASGPAAIDGTRAHHIRLLRPVLDEHGQEAVWEHMAALAAASGAPPVLSPVGEFLRRRFFATHPAGLRAMGEQLLGEPDRVDALAATGIPLLVLTGENDDAWSPAAQSAMADRLGARHVVLPGAAHSPNVEAPDDTASALVEFWHAVEKVTRG